MMRKGDEPTATAGPILGRGSVGAVTLLTSGGASSGPPRDGQLARMFDRVQGAKDRTICRQPFPRRQSTVALPTAQSAWGVWQRLHRLVSLSGLGWAFVAAAVLWELFALDLSQCAGCGWDKGGFFVAWGLGILAFGFCLRTSMKRRAISGLFLGVNILVVSVLALVVGTR